MEEGGFPKENENAHIPRRISNGGKTTGLELTSAVSWAPSNPISLVETLLTLKGLSRVIF